MISVIIPWIRKDGYKRCVQYLKLGNPKFSFEVVAKEDKERIGCPKMVKELVSKSKSPYVMFLGDDTVPCYNLLSIAMKEMLKFEDHVGLVGLNDQFQSGPTRCTHWLASKKLLPFLDDEFFHTGYKHLYCDDELLARCLEMGKYRYCKEAIITHLHPIVQRDDGLVDSDYIRVYSNSYARHDYELFLHRKENNWDTITGDIVE